MATQVLRIKRKNQFYASLVAHGRIPDFPEQCVGKDGL